MLLALQRYETDGVRIETKYKVQTKTFPLDFTATSEIAYEELSSILQSLNISVLGELFPRKKELRQITVHSPVNNVGKSHDMPVQFSDTPLKEMNDIIAINITGTLRITHIVLPLMMKRSKRSLILNISSISGLIPTPLLATYSASKAFLGHFTLALRRELKETSVDVKLIRPYFFVSYSFFFTLDQIVNLPN